MKKVVLAKIKKEELSATNTVCSFVLTRTYTREYTIMRNSLRINL